MWTTSMLKTTYNNNKNRTTFLHVKCFIHETQLPSICLPSKTMLPFLVAFLPLVAAWSGQAGEGGEGCCTPDQWEGYQPMYGGYTTYNHKRGEVKVGFACIFLDI